MTGTWGDSGGRLPQRGEGAAYQQGKEKTRRAFNIGTTSSNFPALARTRRVLHFKRGSSWPIGGIPISIIPPYLPNVSSHLLLLAQGINNERVSMPPPLVLTSFCQPFHRLSLLVATAAAASAAASPEDIVHHGGRLRLGGRRGGERGGLYALFAQTTQLL